MNFSNLYQVYCRGKYSKLQALFVLSLCSLDAKEQNTKLSWHQELQCARWQCWSQVQNLIITQTSLERKLMRSDKNQEPISCCNWSIGEKNHHWLKWPFSDYEASLRFYCLTKWIYKTNVPMTTYLPKVEIIKFWWRLRFIFLTKPFHEIIELFKNYWWM